MPESSSKITFDPGNVHIAGKKTVRDWQQFRTKLVPGNTSSLWGEAFRSYFHKRLATRYLKPLDLLQANDTLAGEGFSILAIHCTLIEFLESTIQGLSYHYVRPKDLGQYEYRDSGKLFVNFLSKRHPFSDSFDGSLATDFYRSVRCALLHEARTKNNWIIKASGPAGVIVSVQEGEKAVFRNNFRAALLEFINWYKNALSTDAAVQEGFKRKFDSLSR